MTLQVAIVNFGPFGATKGDLRFSAAGVVRSQIVHSAAERTRAGFSCPMGIFPDLGANFQIRPECSARAKPD
jgi:hypothetical protein